MNQSRAPRWLAMLASVLWLGAAHGADTPADRLLALGRTPTNAKLAQIKQDAYALFAQMNVPQWTRDQFELMDKWDLKTFPPGARVDGVYHAIVMVDGPVSIANAGYAVIIATGDVEVARGTGLLVVAGGNVRYSHNTSREWSGVFVAKGQFSAPWVVNATIHAGKGAQLRANSLGVHAYNASVRPGPPIELTHSSGARVFSDSPPAPASRAAASAAKAGFRFAGERCAKAVPIAEVADNVPKMARSKVKCGDIDAVLVSCSPDGSEQWTVHICQNGIVDVRSRFVSGRGEFDFYNPVTAKIPLTSHHVTKSTPPPPPRPGSPTAVPRPGVPEADSLVNPLYEEAMKLAAQGRRDEAIVLYERIVSIDPRRWNAHVNLASLKNRRGDAKDALQHYDRAIEIGAPAAVYGSRGLLLLGMGERGRGLQDLEYSAQVRPRDSTILHNRGIGRFYAGDIDGAIADFDAVIKMNAAPELYQYRGWSYLLKQRPREACNDAVQSLVMLRQREPNEGTPAQAAYSLTLGHYACVQASESARIAPWFEEWRARLPADAWPEAFVAYLRGEATEAALQAASTFPHRAGEIDAFLGLDAQQKRRTEEARKRFQRAITGAGGYNLARALGEHFATAHR